jgi:hypothetical protein
VGESGQTLRKRLSGHRSEWWGKHGMYVTFLQKAEFVDKGTRKRTQNILIDAIRPPAVRRWRS